MKQTFSRLFEVAFSHNYFADTILRNIEIVPTPATRQRLGRAGIILKKTDSGLIGLIELREIDRKDEKTGQGKPKDDKQKAKDDFLNTISKLPDQIFPLTFAIQPTDVYFENYSELPLNKSFGQTYFLSTRNSKSEEVTISIEGLEGEKKLVLLKPLLFEYPLPASTPSDKSIKLVDSNKRELLKTINYPDNDSPKSILVDLRQWGTGLYQLQIDDKIQLSFYADGYLHSTRPWGILEINEFSPAEEQLISIKFSARKTYWRYIVEKKNFGESLSELRVIPGFGIGTNSPSESEPLTLIFTSTAPIELSERAKQQYKLITPQDAKTPEIVYLSNSPQARKETLKRDVKNPEKLISEIYVYV